MDHAQDALTALTGDAKPPPVLNAPRPAQPPHRPFEQQPPAPHTDRRAEPNEPPVIPPEQIEQLRRGLPPPIAPGERGRKTHGRWITPHGNAEPIVSGKDDDSDAADTMLKNMGMRAASAKTADVEIKLAAHMVREGIQHATVVITTCVRRSFRLRHSRAYPAATRVYAHRARRERRR
ncbi:hypothetical protein FHS29_006661 [Saccharothrix tamanrassetensis]|uniref:Uncharacterized protein n=1 Tax=Saccharothrix tamanrassetensis TaxID=1051531 RepID=A0A841CRW1_9PSEU|nr:DddA-like double-stranded DNA deaminase toxin [Saccharothrix tamanrassetensis]MBB5960039.1 hypothetical protein [Saccharothrix tamanrassetensis]